MTGIARMPKDLIERIESETDKKKIFTSTREGLPVFNGSTFEEHLSAWATIDESMQCRFWAMAAVASSLVSKHNEKTIATFAHEVRKSARRVREYAQAYRAFENGGRSPILSFSHHCVASTANNPVRAVQLAEDKEWSTRELERWIQLNELNRKTKRLVGLPTPGQVASRVLDGAPASTESEGQAETGESEEQWETHTMSAEDEARLRTDIETGLRHMSVLKTDIQSPYVLRMVNGWAEELEWELIQITNAPGKISDRVLSLIRSGCFVREEIARRAKLDHGQTDRALALLVKAGHIEQRRQGGKTDVARGERTILWMPVDMPLGSDLNLYKPTVEYHSDDED